MRTKEKFSFTLTPEVREQASELARQKGMTLSTMVEQLLRRELETDAQAKQETAKANRRRTS